MPQVIGSSEAPQAHIGALVKVPYGYAFGYAPLVGEGRIIEEKTYRGVEYVTVAPVSGIKFNKVYARSEIIGYVWPESIVVVSAVTAEAITA